jgi:hypothetical protein
VIGGTGARDVYATVGAGGSLGCNPLRAHLGLGDAQRIEFVEVRWPASGDAQRVTGVEPDSAIAITQGGDKVERRPHAPSRLPTSN